jgi:hypothetical protein
MRPHSTDSFRHYYILSDEPDLDTTTSSLMSMTGWYRSNAAEAAKSICPWLPIS